VAILMKALGKMLAGAGVLVAAMGAGMPSTALAQTEPACTDTLSSGGIEAEANRRPDRVICLDTAYYTEPRDAVIAIYQRDVRVQPAPGEHPIVCGRFVVRGPGSSVSPDLAIDPTCRVYFNEASPWNLAGGTFPSMPVPSSWYADFDGTGNGPLELSRDWDHGKAIFKADPADPVTATFRIADSSQCMNDPLGCRHWQPSDPAHRVADESAPAPDSIPIPAGVRCPGLPNMDDLHDRALVVISADSRTAWEFWHCTHVATPAEPWYTAAVATKWSLNPGALSSRGYQDGDSNGARASGAPLLASTITPSETLFGIHHAIGLTVKAVSNQYYSPPASHTDGCAGCAQLRYGMLFVLDPSYKPPVRPTLGESNVIEALKHYGAYVVDRGPQFEIDGSPNEPTDPADSDALWSAASVAISRFGIKPSDFRYVPMPGQVPPAQ
jgi:hypothetical protein